MASSGWRICERIITGSLMGLIVGPLALLLAGFVVGGYTRMAPCHSAPDFISGALFGTLAVAWQFGIPAIVAGFILGAITATLLNRWQPSPWIVALVMMMVAFMVAVSWILWGWNWYERELSHLFFS